MKRSILIVFVLLVCNVSIADEKNNERSVAPFFDGLEIDYLITSSIQKNESESFIVKKRTVIERIGFKEKGKYFVIARKRDNSEQIIYALTDKYGLILGMSENVKDLAISQLIAKKKQYSIYWISTLGYARGDELVAGFKLGEIEQWQNKKTVVLSNEAEKLYYDVESGFLLGSMVNSPRHTVIQEIINSTGLKYSK